MNPLRHLQRFWRALSGPPEGFDAALEQEYEEFAALLPETGMREGLATAERVRAAVENCAAATADGDPIRVTVSVGVAALEPGGETLETLLERADQALYQAKSEGRNRVVVSQAMPRRETAGSGGD